MLPKLQTVHSSLASSISIRRDVIPFTDYPLHYHKEFEIVYVEKSFGVRIIGNHIGNFFAGDLMFLSPDLPHIWKNDKIFHEDRPDYYADIYVINFREDALTEHFFDLPEFQNLKKLFALSKQGIRYNNKKEKKTISNLIKRAHACSGIERLIFFLYTLEALTKARDYSLLSGMGYTDSVNKSGTDRINQVISFLMENYTRDIDLNEISILTNLNKSSFCRFFKARTKKTLFQFLNEIRIAHACKKLTLEHKTITSICYETGYNNISHFNRQFKKVTGLTAKEYAKKYSNN